MQIEIEIVFRVDEVNATINWGQKFFGQVIREC